MGFGLDCVNIYNSRKIKYKFKKVKYQKAFTQLKKYRDSFSSKKKINRIKTSMKISYI